MRRTTSGISSDSSSRPCAHLLFAYLGGEGDVRCSRRSLASNSSRRLASEDSSRGLMTSSFGTASEGASSAPSTESCSVTVPLGASSARGVLGRLFGSARIEASCEAPGVPRLTVLLVDLHRLTPAVIGPLGDLKLLGETLGSIDIGELLGSGVFFSFSGSGCFGLGGSILLCIIRFFECILREGGIAEHADAHLLGLRGFGGSGDRVRVIAQHMHRAPRAEKRWRRATRSSSITRVRRCGTRCGMPSACVLARDGGHLATLAHLKRESDGFVVARM